MHLRRGIAKHVAVTRQLRPRTSQILNTQKGPIMPEPKSLHDMFIDELRDAYDAEKQLTKALPKLARAAVSDELREAFESHLTETQGHVTRLEQVFASLEEKPRGKHCDGIAGIIDEGKAVLEEDIEEDAVDACLIAAGQRAEHYEIAAYGTLVAWARTMEHTEAADLLEETLEEEKAADEKLTSLAEGGINEQAARSAQGGGEEESEEEEEPVGKSSSKSSSASRPATGKKTSLKR
jgi:ferritin-like metal-binding protein YciE